MHHHRLALIHTTLHHISRALSVHIKRTGSLPRKVLSFLNDKLGVKKPCLYSISYRYGQVYIGQTRVTEHH